MKNIKILSLSLAFIFTVGVGTLVIAESTSEASQIETVAGKKDKKKCKKDCEKKCSKKCKKDGKECKKKSCSKEKEEGAEQ